MRKTLRTSVDGWNHFVAKARPGGPVVCFRCRGQGHMARRCTNPEKCLRCGGDGHRQFTCLMPKPSGTPARHEQGEQSANIRPAISPARAPATPPPTISVPWSPAILGNVELLRTCLVGVASHRRTTLESVHEAVAKALGSEDFHLSALTPDAFILHVKSGQPLPALTPLNPSGSISWRLWRVSDGATGALPAATARSILFHGIPLHLRCEEVVAALTAPFGWLVATDIPPIGSPDVFNVRAEVVPRPGSRPPSTVLLAAAGVSFRITATVQPPLWKTWAGVVSSDSSMVATAEGGAGRTDTSKSCDALLESDGTRTPVAPSPTQKDDNLRPQHSHPTHPPASSNLNPSAYSAEPIPTDPTTSPDPNPPDNHLSTCQAQAAPDVPCSQPYPATRLKPTHPLSRPNHMPGTSRACVTPAPNLTIPTQPASQTSPDPQPGPGMQPPVELARTTAELRHAECQPSSPEDPTTASPRWPPATSDSQRQHQPAHSYLERDSSCSILAHHTSPAPQTPARGAADVTSIQTQTAEVSADGADASGHPPAPHQPRAKPARQPPDGMPCLPALLLGLDRAPCSKPPSTTIPPILFSPASSQTTEQQHLAEQAACYTEVPPPPPESRAEDQRHLAAPSPSGELVPAPQPQLPNSITAVVISASDCQATIDAPANPPVAPDPQGIPAPPQNPDCPASSPLEAPTTQPSPTPLMLKPQPPASGAHYQRRRRRTDQPDANGPSGSPGLSELLSGYTDEEVAAVAAAAGFRLQCSRGLGDKGSTRMRTRSMSAAGVDVISQ